jgi:hypothetical protein
MTTEEKYQGEIKASALLDRCDGCHAENALYNPKRLQHECSRCGALYDVGDNAKAHLQSLITPMLKAWIVHYKHRGVGQLEQGEIVRDIGDKLIETLWQEKDDEVAPPEDD